MSEKSEIAVIHTDVEPDQVVVAVLLFDGKKWTLRTVAPPEPEMMRDIKRGLSVLAAQFEREGF